MLCRRNSIAILAALLLSAEAVAAHTIEYADFEGARRESPEDGYWEVGWVAPHHKVSRSWIYPVKGLEGVCYKSFGSTSTGNRSVTVSDMGLDEARGIPLPLLGIKGDLYVTTHRNVECPVRYYADDGRVALEWWTSGYFAKFYLGSLVEMREWVAETRTVEERAKLMRGGQFMPSARSALLDSRWLDTDGDGAWSPKTLLTIRNYAVPLSLQYVMILPATTVDIPVQRGWQQGAEVTFEYRVADGHRKAAFLLDPSSMPEQGMLRIGFVGRAGSADVYVVQNPGRGKEGIIVGKAPALEGRLRIKPGTLQVKSAKWVPYDRVPVDSRKLIGREGCPTDDFRAFDSRDTMDWGYLCSYFVKPGTKFAGKAFPKRNPYSCVRRDQVDRHMQDALRIAHKYGMRVALMIDGETTPSSYIPDQYKGEVLDPETGHFVKAGFLDWASEEAAAWEGRNIEQRLRAFRGIPVYAVIHEGTGSAQSNNMSLAALASFRKFVGDAKAKFPVPPTSPETDRTTNRFDERLVQKYIEWKLGYYRGRTFMLGVLKPAYRALKGGHFRGVGYFGGVSDGGAHFVPYLADAPEVAILCPENVDSRRQAIFQVWREAARKHADRIHLLCHSYPMRINTRADRFIEWFEDVGLSPEVDGLLLGGGGKIPQKLFLALACKHFGRGRMSVKEAETIIATCREKGIFYADGAQRPQTAKKPPQQKAGLQMETARRVPAPRRTCKVDGKLDDWASAEWTIADSKEYVFVGRDKWQGKDDLSYSFALAYDADFLFVAVRVLDEKLVLRGQTLATTGDEVELFVGFVDEPVKEPVIMRANGFQFRIIPDKKYGHVYLGYNKLEPVKDSRAAMSRSDAGYVVEAALPWRDFEYTPRKGGFVPTELHILDADQPAGNIESTMLWNVFEGKQKPWSAKGTRQWGVAALK